MKAMATMICAAVVAVVVLASGCDNLLVPDTTPTPEPECTAVEPGELLGYYRSQWYSYEEQSSVPSDGAVLVFETGTADHLDGANSKLMVYGQLGDLWAGCGNGDKNAVPTNLLFC